jgi:hypothetical protein
LIFTTSTTYPDNVKPFIERVENQKLGQQVVLVKQWSLPTFKYEISIGISKSRPFNIIEEFIIKIALSGIKETIDQGFVSNLLGLDEIFVDKYASDLANKNVIDREIGKEYFNKGLVPVDLIYEKVDVYFDSLFKSLYHKSGEVNRLPTLKEARMIEFSELGLREEIEKHLNKQVINNLGKRTGIIFERDDLGQKIIDISASERYIEHGRANFIEIWIYDIVEDKLFCRVWDEIQEIYRDDVEDYVAEKNPPHQG